MDTVTTVKSRRFELIRISEEEGLVLRTLLNLNDVGVTTALLQDKLYWGNELSIEEATRIGIEICDKVMAMVDGDQ
jgi:hypothetical protein